MKAPGSEAAALSNEAAERSGAVRALAWVRPEEWVLLAVLAGCIALCLTRGHGFNGAIVLSQYFAFFADKVLLVFAFTRIAFFVEAAWQPQAGSAAERAKRFVFGSADRREGLLATDLEVVRGLVLMFCTLTVYTNVKLRIPLLNPVVGDATFQKIDDAIFGTQLWPWLENYTRTHQAFADFLESVYFHDYMYFVVLVLLLYLRHDRLALRWIFQAVAFTYILGILITVAYPNYGPCFIRREDFAWIQESMEMVANTQRQLWRYFSYVVQTGSKGGDVQGQVFMGIAAFPSLHVGHMALLSFVAWKRYRIYVPLVVVMTLLTFVATMAFGWHYAVDAFGGIALAWAVCAVLWKFLPKEEASV